MYVRTTIASRIWTFSADDLSYELMWALVGDSIAGALYHPPRSQYTTESILAYIEASVEELLIAYPTTLIILAGDFNQLTDCEVTMTTGLHQIVRQPHGALTC